MRRVFFILILSVFLGPPTVDAVMVSRIAAVVNKDIITTYQLDQKLQEQLAKRDKQPSPAQLGALRQELLSRMIEETLVQQRIRDLNLTVTEEEIETALLDVQKKNQLTREELKEAVIVQGMEFEAYRENLRQQILRYKLIGQEVRSQVDVPESEIVDYYRAHLDEYRLEPEISLSALTFPVSDKASKQEQEKIRSVVREALERLQQGEKFQDVAFDYNSTYGATSAELGSFDYADLTPAFLKAIEGVDEGEITKPVEVSGAIHLLKVDERVPGRLRQFDAVKNDIYQTILDQKTDAKIKEWTQALKTRAFIDIRL